VAADKRSFPNASNPLVKTPDGFVFLDPANFAADFDVERAHSRKVEVEGASHAVYVSHPKEVAALIEDAAQHAVP
jgi:pimeloyl-ACP methyl ester carboxylesterase